MTPEEIARYRLMEVHVKQDGMAPCPFCGSEDVRAELTPATTVWTMACISCGSIGPFTDGKGALMAIEKWNRRLSVPEDLFGCALEHLGVRYYQSCPFCGSQSLEYDDDLDPEENRISCHTCRAYGPAGHGNPEMAYTAWNRRSG